MCWHQTMHRLRLEAGMERRAMSRAEPTAASRAAALSPASLTIPLDSLQSFGP